MPRLLSVILFVFVIGSAHAGTAPPGNIAVSVESRPIAFYPATANLFQANDTIDLTIETGDLEISGINLKIALTPGDLTITDILPGPFVDSCRWEYFEARPVRSETNISLNIWQITTVSELIPDSIQPLCYRMGGEVTLARLIIQGNAHTAPQGSQQINFYWESCADNSISDKSGNKLFVSKSLFDPTGEIVTIAPEGDPTEPFPTKMGTPSSCVNETNPNRPLRRINFHVGWLSFQVKVEESAPADSAGE